MADLKEGVVTAAADEASKQNEILASSQGVVVEKAVEDGKWRNSLKSTVLECSVEAAWDLVSDWGRWSWYTQPDSITQTAGEHRKAGCVRLIRYPTMWLSERAIVIDNDKRVLSYSIEENDAFGGIKGFVARTKFQATSDGKTLIPYWDYEVEPLDNFTPETYQTLIESVFKPIFDDLENGAQRLAAGLDPRPVHTSDPAPPTET